MSSGSTGPDLPSVVTAGVAVVSAIGSLIGWYLAFRERKEAERQADAATKAATKAATDSVAELRRLADAAESQDKRRGLLNDGTEQHPWLLDPVPRDPFHYWLRNNSGTPKYMVTVTGSAADPRQGQLREVGAKGHVQIGVLGSGGIVHNEVVMHWHQEHDASDAARSQTCTLPPGP